MTPAPPINASCQVGSDKGYVSRTSSGLGVNPNAVCTIVASGRTFTVPFTGNPMPALNAPCRIGDVNGYISSTSAGTNASAQSTPFSGPQAGHSIPYSATPPPPLSAPCTIGSDPGYISRTSGQGGNANSVCTVAPASGGKIEAPYYANPAPSLDAPCQVGNLGGYISKTTGPSSNANAQCTVVSPPFCRARRGVGTAVAYYANPAPALAAPCKVGLDTGFVSSTSRPGPTSDAICTIVYNGATIQAPYYGTPAPPIGSSCSVGDGFRGKITSSNTVGTGSTASSPNPVWSPGSKDFDLVWITNSDGTNQKSGVDRNGYPLNPMWHKQMKDPTNPSNNPTLLGTCANAYFPQGLGTSIPFPGILDSCSTQNPQQDLYSGPLSSFGVCQQADTIMEGHLNFSTTTYTGSLWFDDYSSSAACGLTNIPACGADHDFNLSLIHGDYSGLTSSYSDEDVGPDGAKPNPPRGQPPANQSALHLEFYADETSDRWFSSDWWKKFRDTAESNADVPLTGAPAIVTGLLGIDAVHRGGFTELHPVYSMALHDATDDPDVWGRNRAGQAYVDEHWHFFIRNAGTEGTCSSQVWTWKSLSGNNDYYIQLPWAVLNGTPASSVKVVGARAYAWANAVGTPSFEIAQGKWVYLHFNLPSPPQLGGPFNSDVLFGTGYDGNITLEYTFPSGVLTSQSRPRVTAKLSRKVDSDDEAEWKQVQARITDPAVRLKLLQALAPPPLVHSQGKPLTFRDGGAVPLVDLQAAVQARLLRPEGAVDPIKARMEAQIRQALGTASGGSQPSSPAVTSRDPAARATQRPTTPTATAPAARCAPTYPARPLTQGARVLMINSAQSTAEGAQVFLDGQCQGTIRADGTGFSLMLENIPPNRAYVVSVRRAGFRPFEQQITVPASAVPYANSPKVVMTFVLSPQ